MLEIQNVSKTFNAGTVNEKTALNGLNLKLNEGDFVTVIGGNGAGKSTMLNAVAGVWPVDCGKIIIDGVDVTRLSEHQRAAYIGRVFQDPMTGTAATMQIEENLALAARRAQQLDQKRKIVLARHGAENLQRAVAGLGEHFLLGAERQLACLHLRRGAEALIALLRGEMRAPARRLALFFRACGTLLADAPELLLGLRIQLAERARRILFHARGDLFHSVHCVSAFPWARQPMLSSIMIDASIERMA